LIEWADGHPPHHEENIMRAIMLIVNEPAPMPKEKASENFRMFLSLCLQKDPRERPSAELLLNVRLLLLF
jgi:serine/threonine-protein kinase 24/25/MST4